MAGGSEGEVHESPTPPRQSGGLGPAAWGANYSRDLQHSVFIAPLSAVFLEISPVLKLHRSSALH